MTQPDPQEPYGQPQSGQPQYGQPQYGPPQYPQYPQYGPSQQGYGYPGPPPRRVSLPVTGWVLMVAALVVFIGSVSPWATVHVLGDISVNGTRGDGSITLVFAIIMAVVGLLIGIGQGRLWTAIVGVVFAAFTVVTAGIDAANISRLYSGAQSDLIDVGFGLWLTVVGDVVALGAGIAALVRRQFVGGGTFQGGGSYQPGGY